MAKRPTKKNPTHTTRAARALAAGSSLTYAQALAAIRAAGQVPDLSSAEQVSAFLAVASTPAPASAAATASAQPAPAGNARPVPKLADLVRRAEELFSDLDSTMQEWDGTDSVDTTLGVEISERGGHLLDLAGDVARRLPDESGDLQAAMTALAAAVDYYDELEEHDTNASIDIVDSLGPVSAQVASLLDLDDPDTPFCRFCHQRAGRDYHLAGVIPESENNVVCDDCWDERLR